MDHLFDRQPDERRIVDRIGDLDVGRELLGDLLDLGLHQRDGVERVGARRQLHAEACCLLAVVARLEAVVFRAHFDPGDIGKAHGGAAGGRANDDLAELFRSLQTRLRGDGRVERLALDRGKAADLTGGNLCVLRGDCRGDVGDGDAEVRHLERIDPDPHRILRAEHLRVADALDPAERILELGGDQIAEIDLVMAAVLRIGGDHEQEVGGRLGHAKPGLLHFLRQERGRLLQLVLHLDLRDVRVGALFEGQRDREIARAIAGRCKVAKVVDPLHLLLDDLRRRVLERLRVGARIGRCDRHLGRGDLGELRDRQRPDRQDAGQHQDDRDDPCEDGSIDEIA